MYSEARKLHLIEEVLKISDDATLVALEDVVKKSHPVGKSESKSFAEFSGIWSAEEAAQIEKTIQDSCEEINSDDWK